ncbi:kinase-like domain-containing protein [Armillaria luteobubalina]|uniref:mitogen-activated protein kinase kinase n=1 Tax=Armillaria luteobubalina TaxID=153913 RepID=A0AA39QKQ8_9AGAR|nr:kinase-like domain-containing protein [Armillaria luteobubalina]
MVGLARPPSLGLRRAGKPVLGNSSKTGAPAFQTSFSSFSHIVDASGSINFAGKASINASGVNFVNGASFAVRMEDFEQLEELGRGNYGTVKRVLHMPTNVEMAMKQIRVELESAKFKTIEMELEILHRAVAPSIIGFFGAFYDEGCVHYCLEYMDARSLDTLTAFDIDERFNISGESLTWEGLPEEVLARIVGSTDELEVIHRDVKPTNILANNKGEIKLCDFGVSGQLQKSLAMTVVGCQTYMAPERIESGLQPGNVAYGVSSDVWSLGLSTLEIAMGKYPYPVDSRGSAMAYMTALINGDVPALPERYSSAARAWVSRCLVTNPDERANYAELLAHPFLAEENSKDVDMIGWVATALKFKAAKASRGKI